MFKNSSLTIITPIYNEEEILLQAINNTLACAQPYFNTIEYIIVNDGSTDESTKIIDQNFTSQPFKIIHKENGGFGSAIKIGIKEATSEYIICIPADSPLDKDTAESFFKSNLEADIVVSFRLERKGYSKWMLLNSKVFHFLVAHIFNMQLKDFNWIHLYKAKIFNEIKIESNGIFMLAEVLIKAKKLHYTFTEVPVSQKQRLTGIATASKPSAILKTIFELLKLYFG